MILNNAKINYVHINKTKALKNTLLQDSVSVDPL